MDSTLRHRKAGAVDMARSSPSLANRRVVAGYTQDGLARALGVAPGTVGRWERGERLPRPWQRPDLARRLGVTLDQLDEMLRPTAVRAEFAQ